MFIELVADDWAYAARLGEARRRSNDRNRMTNRDRGNANNIHVDLMGSVAEFVAFKHLRQHMTPEEQTSTIKGMFRPEGGKGKHGCDLKISQLSLSLDVKSFDCDSKKRYFAINKSKHKDLLGQCDGYFCVIAPKYSSLAYVVQNVAYESVSQWEERLLGSYGDPSLNLPIGTFESMFMEPGALERLKKAKLIDRSSIDASIRDADNQRTFFGLFPDTERYLKTNTAK